jgi:hypothetical protein
VAQEPKGSIIDKSNKIKYMQIKSQAPWLNVVVKLHKETTIRPIVNYKNAPTYHIAKVMTKWLKQNTELSFKYSVDNWLQCE